MSAETFEKRKRKVDDVGKRAAYRKAHGLDKDEGFGGWTAKTDEQSLGPAIPTGDSVVVESGETAAEPVVREKRVLKKWFGIW